MARIKYLTLALFMAATFLWNLSTLSEAQVGRSQLLNPDVASEKDLLALPHLNATLVKSIIEQRPFFAIRDLDALLAKSLNKEQRVEVYGKMFVLVNLNSAREDELLTIPGVDKRVAGEMLKQRPYRSIEQFHKAMAKTVDPKELGRVEQYVFVPINLNTASDDDILTIPGMGKRMLREFKEYRPYTNIEQFRKEIGKYVDKKEVARLERYVTLN